MSKDLATTNIPNSGKGQFLVYEAEDGKVKIDVRLEDETVWLTQKLVADMYQVTVPTINEHIKNIFDERELIPDATIRKFRIVQKEGQRNIARMIDYYNLNMIISVGYRVKSHVATRFRIWATQRLPEYIIKGFVLDDEREILTHAGRIAHESVACNLNISLFHGLIAYPDQVGRVYERSDWVGDKL